MKRSSFFLKLKTAHLYQAGLVLACVTTTVGWATPEDRSHVVNGCADIEDLLEQGELEPHVRYTGPQGFTFKLKHAGDAAEAVSVCLELEQSLSALVGSGIPGASVSYRASGYRILAAQGEAEITEPRPMHAKGLFRVASITKTYIGALAALAAIEGDLDLDNTDGLHSLVDYLPEVDGKIQYADRITVRQLLNHSSGVPDYYGDELGPAWVDLFLERYHAGLGVSDEDALSIVYGQPALFEPGTAAWYSNTGYILAGRVLDRALGRPYQDALRERFFGPLGLSASFMEKHDFFNPARLSHGYRDAAPLGEDFSDWFAVDQGYGFANDALVASAPDVGEFFRAIPGGKGHLPGVPMSALLDELRPAEPGGYGLGIGEESGCYWHLGELTGYESAAFTCPGPDLTVVLFANSSRPEDAYALRVWAYGMMLAAGDGAP